MNMLFVVGVIAIAAIGFYFYQQSSNTLKQLQAEGFVVDETIPSNPRIVIDRQHRRAAVIYAGSYEAFSFDQFVSASIQAETRSDDKSHRKVNIVLADHPKEKLQVRGRKVRDVDSWVATLNGLKDS